MLSAILPLSKNPRAKGAIKNWNNNMEERKNMVANRTSGKPKAFAFLALTFFNDGINQTNEPIAL